MKCLLSVCLAGVVGVAVDLALSNVLQSPPLQKGISVQMAVSANATVMPEADNRNAWIVAVASDGRLYFGIDPVSPSNLYYEMKNRGHNRPQKLYIKADARVPFASVEKALASAHAADFDTPVLLTSQPESATPATIVPPRGLEVQLASLPPGSQPVVVQIHNSGQGPSTVMMNNQPVSWDALQSAVSQSLQNHSEKAVSVEADGRAPFAEVVRVIDACHGAGTKVILDADEL